MAVAVTNEIPCERERDDQLHQGSAEGADKLAEGTEDEMAGFMDGEIDAVEEAIMIGDENVVQAVEAERDRQREPAACWCAYLQPRRLRTKSCSTRNFSYNRTPFRLRPNSANSSRSLPRRAT